jgi:tRNA uridine 5-carboxymethylaminomethyl modification enzyme
MFTSRAEHRLILREDNTVDRLYLKSLNIGIQSPEIFDKMKNQNLRRDEMMAMLRSSKIYPDQKTQDILLSMDSPVLQKSISFEELLRRSEIDCSNLSALGFQIDNDPNVNEMVEIEVKYSGYVKRQLELIEQTKRLEYLKLPELLNYSEIKGLSREEVEKLTAIKPRTLGQAQRISGVNPSAIQSIMVYLKGSKRKMREIEVGIGL